MRTPQVTVVGAGSWGTTIASLTARNAPTLLWARRPELAVQITTAHENPDYLAGFPLNPDLRATADIADAAARADVIIMAVPTHSFRRTLTALAPHTRPWIPVVSLSKGLEAGTHKRMTQLIEEELPGHPAGALSGPNLAKELLKGQAAAAVIAMHDHSVAQQLQAMVRTTMFRVYTATDVIGVELGGALKNVVAIAAGMADGLGTGDNTRAAVITRGVAEMTRLGVAMGGDPATFAGLAGLGDAMATCISPLSRNRCLGVELARGRTAEQVSKQWRMVVEGIRTSRAACELAEQFGVDAPIFREVDAVVNGWRTPNDAFQGLLQIKPATEDEAG